MGKSKKTKWKGGQGPSSTSSSYSYEQSDPERGELHAHQVSSSSSSSSSSPSRSKRGALHIDDDNDNYNDDHGGVDNCNNNKIDAKTSTGRRTGGDDDDDGAKRRRIMIAIVCCSVFVLVVIAVVLSVVLTRSSSDSSSSNINSQVRPQSPPSSDSSSSALLVPPPSLPSVEDEGETNELFNSSSTISDPTTVPAPAPAPNTTSPSSFPSDGPSMIPSSSPSMSPPSQTPTSTPTAGAPEVDPNLLVTLQTGYELLEVVPHDTNAFTQGLEVLSLPAKQVLGDSAPPATSSSTTTRYMLESTGLYGSSDLRVVDIATGKLLTIVPIDGTYFAEGCTFDIIEDDGPMATTKIQIVQLTWKAGEGFVYELDLPFDGSNIPTTTQLRYVGKFNIDTTTGEGWGVAYHPIRKQYIVSDGSSNLHMWELQGQTVLVGQQQQQQQSETIYSFVRVQTLGVTRRFSTNENWSPVENLNELEWDPYPSLLDNGGGNGIIDADDDTILANVWTSDYIVRIRLSDGRTTHQYDMTSIKPPNSRNVLNGIAAVLDSSTDPASSLSRSIADAEDQYWITGKFWPLMFRVRLLS